MQSTLETVRPDRIFNFGAQSFVPSSWTQPILTAQYTGLGVVRLLEAARRAVPNAGSSRRDPASCSRARSIRHRTRTRRSGRRTRTARPRHLRITRCAAYRAQYGQFATNAVFFTNESLRRSPGVRISKGHARRGSRLSPVRPTTSPSAAWTPFVTGATRRSTPRCRSRCWICPHLVISSSPRAWGTPYATSFRTHLAS